MKQLAINGGKKIREKNFPKYNPIGEEEINQVVEVMKTGILSRFIGGWHKNHYGGFEVQALEEEWKDFFGSKYAVTVNSASSALIAAIGAIGIEPGDEVIVTPYSMCISATAPLFYGAIPVFADVESNTFCLSKESIRSKITKRTKAIIVVDLFGQTYDHEGINALAKEHGLYIIEDASQAPMASSAGKYAGTLGDIGIFSLNYHKHIHCGEGGVLVTNSAELADKLQLIRNHAEAVVDGKGYKDLTNMIGFNFRMGELEAAITRQQLKKLPSLISTRIEKVNYFSERIKGIPCIQLYENRENSVHVYYKMAMKYDISKGIVHRNKFVEAVKAELMPFELREDEGVNISNGYVKPIYLLPAFQQKIAFGSLGYPFNLSENKLEYSKNTCPIVEDAHFDTLICHEFIQPTMKKEDIDDVIRAFEKVWENRSELQ